MKQALFLALALLLGSPDAGAQMVTGASSGFQRLYSTGVSVGNGADTTEDILQTFTLAAGQLANVGDTIHIRAGGALGGTTDNKTVRVRIPGIGGGIYASAATNTAASTNWYIDLAIVKTGPNTQAYIADAIVTSFATAAKSGTTALTDTTPLQIVVTGANITSSVAGSITCQSLIVDYEH